MTPENHQTLTLGERLAQAMKNKSRRDGARVTNAALAEAVGVSATTISYWLNDRGSEGPKKEALQKAAHFLGVSVAWLEHGAEREQSGSSPDRAIQETSSVSPRPSVPQELRIAAKRFELEAVELGADDRAIAFIHHTLTGDPAVSMFYGGYKEPSIEEMKKQQEGVIIGLRIWLEEYMKRQREAKRR